jgi:uncharacterized membrane protein
MAEEYGMRRSESGWGEANPARRWGALIAGSTIAIYGLSRRSPAGVALATAGGMLAYFGAQPQDQREFTARSSMIVNTSQQEAFRFWRNFENFPLFMNHLESVNNTSERRSRWIALGPMGTRIEWEAEIINERVNEEIQWRSLPGSDIDIDGQVRFSQAPGGRGTMIRVYSHLVPPAGALGRAVANIFGKNPEFLMRQDLRRLKALMETGEIPTIEGQTHGPRSMKIAALRMMDPDNPVRVRDAKIKDVLNAERSIA